MANKFKIQIPASSSNLGPGFDCFGLALNIFNEYIVELLDSSGDFEIDANLDKSFCPESKDNLFYKSFEGLLKKNSIDKTPSIKVQLNAQIPAAGGFGSSGTAVLAGLMAANRVLGNKFSDLEILEEATLIEGHPDNVCASMLGGFCLSKYEDGKLVVKKIDWQNNVDVLMLYPENLRINTQEAREALNQNQSLSNCIANLSNSALFTAAILSKDNILLKESIKDTIHEEARLKLIPGANEIVNMARENNALGATVSGSGASLIVFLDSDSKQVAIKNQASEIWAKHEIKTSSLLCKVSNSGALIY